MGMGFRLNLKWDFPISCPTLTNSPSRLCTSSVQGKEASFDSTRFSFPSVTSEDCETLYKDPFKPFACSSGALQTFENDYSEMEEMKMKIGKCSHGDLFKIVNASQAPIGEDISASVAGLQASKASQFSLLLENLDILEEMFADSNMVRLERDIMVQLGRLGALKLFQICLSRTLKTSTSFDLFSAPTEHIRECQTNGTVDDHLDKVVVRSGKKEERKSKRERALEKADNIYAFPLPSKTIRKGPGRPSVSTVKRTLNSRSKRLMNAKNEAEMSKGVKLVANLERIRATLEEEIGHVASLSNWAEAAGVDKKVLQQQLQFGWYCRDELLRSTHSLVVYIARNYRGMGVAFEDILQAGNLGVLQGAERFDHTKGYRFSTYVQYWIRKSMSTLVARHARGVKIPFTLNRAIGQIQKARKALYKSHGRYPDDNEIAKFTGLSLAKIRSAGNCLRVVGSTDQSFQDCWGATILEFTPDTSIKSPEEGFMRQCKRKDIHNLLKGLDPRERQILVLRYGFGEQQRKSLEEIGRLFNVSKEWIRKLEKTALAKLRDEEICQNLRHYVDV
ncbi:RNA polymerase sigma factor sigC [Vitis riparia]|uniref:RNA polymerase sigma factor sigC n=1 Tax=Vitis riparia TaxID=96939 RepID=UPI00155B0E8F|nr:RNA polymerase sigma factor sigC [Vitis riparia]